MFFNEFLNSVIIINLRIILLRREIKPAHYPKRCCYDNRHAGNGRLEIATNGNFPNPVRSHQICNRAGAISAVMKNRFFQFRAKSEKIRIFMTLWVGVTQYPF